MIVLVIKRGEKWPIIITSGLSIGVLFAWTGISNVILTGLIIYMLSAVFSAVYGVFSKDLPKHQRIIIALTGLFGLFANLSALNHWPYAGEIRLSMAIPLALYLILIYKGYARKGEFGFLTILNTDFLFKLLSYWI